MIRLFILIIQILSFGLVTLGTSSTVIGTDETMQAITFQDYLDSQHYEKEITLTNLIQNGQFTTDSNNDGLADNWTNMSSMGMLPSITENGQKFLANGATVECMGAYQNVVITQNQKYYVSLTMAKSQADFSQQYIYTLGSGEQSLINNLDQNWVSIPQSIIFTSNYNNTSFRFTSYRSYHIQNTFYTMDNVSLFNSSTYTKTQIDTALANYGYLPYNVTTSMYDETDVDFQTLYTEFFGSYSDFELTDLDEVRYISYETTLNDKISLLDIVLLLCGMFFWYCIIKAVGGLL